MTSRRAPKPRPPLFSKFMNPDFKNTFRQEAEHRGLDPEYLLGLAQRLHLPAPQTIDDPVDADEVLAPLDVHCVLRAVSAVHVANFKAFGKSVQRFPIAPITLIFGPNSAGKSSLIQALLYASHIQEKGELKVKHPAKAGTVVDLGNFNNIQNRRQRENTITLGFELAHLFRKAGEGAKPAIWWITIGYKNQRNAPEILTANLEVDGETYLKFHAFNDNSSPSHSIFMDPCHPRVWGHAQHFATHHMGLKAISASQASCLGIDKSVPDIEGHEALLGALLRQSYEISFDGLIPDFSSLEKFPESTEDQEEVKDKNEWLNTWLKKSEASILPAYENLLLKIDKDIGITIRSLQAVIADFLKSIGYLSSSRVTPGRDFENITQRDVNFYVNGCASWEWLASKEGGKTRERLNHWFAELHTRDGRGLAKYQFGVSYDLNRNLTEEAIETETHNYLMEKNQEYEAARARLRVDGSESDEQDLLFDKIDASEITARIMRAIEAKRRATTHRRLTIQDGRSNTEVTTADIGVGIQFLIPVLVEMLSGGDALKIIEEPELHAHPALQAELGDALIEGALSDKRATHSSQFLIETHSEHLILRILRRIREASEGSNKYPERLPKVRPEDVAVIYAEPSSEGTILHHLKITDDGDFIDRWPAGFFTERADELF